MKISPPFLYLLSFYVSVYGMRRKRKRMLRWKPFFFLLVGPYGKSWSWREKCLLSKKRKTKKTCRKVIEKFSCVFFSGRRATLYGFPRFRRKQDLTRKSLFAASWKFSFSRKCIKHDAMPFFASSLPTKKRRKKSPLQTLKNWKLSERNSWFLF